MLGKSVCWLIDVFWSNACTNTINFIDAMKTHVGPYLSCAGGLGTAIGDTLKAGFRDWNWSLNELENWWDRVLVCLKDTMITVHGHGIAVRNEEGQSRRGGEKIVEGSTYRFNWDPTAESSANSGGGTMGNVAQSCMTQEMINTRKGAMEKLYAFTQGAKDYGGAKGARGGGGYGNYNQCGSSGTQDCKSLKGSGFKGEWNCDNPGWQERNTLVARFNVGNGEREMKIAEPCNAQAGLDFDFLLCDQGKVDDLDLWSGNSVTANDPDYRFAKVFTVLSWGNLIFHGSGCYSFVGSATDNAPMAYMFMWMLQRLHTHHGRTDAIGFNRRGGKVGPAWTAGGTGSYYMLSQSTIGGEMDALYNHMNANGPYNWNWAKGISDQFKSAPTMDNVIPLFVKRAIPGCIPDVPSWAKRRDIYIKLWDTVRNILAGVDPAFIDAIESIKMGHHKQKFTSEGCGLLISGALRFANAMVVQPDTGSVNPDCESKMCNNILITGAEVSAENAQCHNANHAKWHWRATGVMRAFLKMTKVYIAKGRVDNAWPCDHFGDC
jgi:hypothetical protein